jgi:hypothetical protein
MKIGIYKIVSSLHDQNYIDANTNIFISNIKNALDCSIDFINESQFNNYDLVLTLIQSGGSENQFKKIYKNLPRPYLLLTYGSNNSLAASMEILSFLHNNHLEGEILHGSISYICERIKYHFKSKNKSFDRFGVIGKPSDWLISSNVDYDFVKEKLGIELINISLDELVEEYKNVDSGKIELVSSFSEKEIQKSFKLYKAMSNIKDKYSLKGLTLRCFSLLNKSPLRQKRSLKDISLCLS